MVTDAEALALLELSALARGLRCLDALVKKAPVTVLEANLIEPGRFLILFAGGVAEVEEAHAEACAVADTDLVEHPEKLASEIAMRATLLAVSYASPLLAALRGAQDVRGADEMDCLGVVEGGLVAPTLRAADRSLKDAGVSLAGLRVSGGLGGRAYYIVFGAQHDVEAALEVAAAQLGERLHRTELIPRPHEEMVVWLLRPAPFAVRPG